jgi:hypothetical protein
VNGTSAIRLVLRGAIGGSLGIVLLFFYMVYRNPYQILGTRYLPIIAFIGASLGLVTGSIVCACSFMLRRRVGNALRSMLGICFILIVAWSFGLLARNTSFQEGSSWAWQGLDWIAILIFLGVLPGLFAKSANRSKKVVTSSGHA